VQCVHPYTLNTLYTSSHEQHDERGVEEGACGVDGGFEVLCQLSIAPDLEETTMNTPQKAAIKKIARIRDKATEQYFDVIEFQVSKGTVSKLALLPSVVNDLGSFAKRLRDAGAILPKGEGKLKNLLATVAKSDPPEEWVYEAQTGWTKNRKAFVLVDGVIGDVKTTIIGVNRKNSVTDPSGRLSSTGSWKSWRVTVAEPARSRYACLGKRGLARASLRYSEHLSLELHESWI